MSVGNEPSEIIEQKLFYKGRKFDYEVVKLRLPNGVAGQWECIRHPGGALAVPVTDDGKFVLVKQYRFTVAGRLLEFPAGTVEANESPFETIKREIEEETGYGASKWQDMGKFILAPGYSDEYVYAFLAQGLEKLATPPHQDEDEDIEVLLMSESELETAILDGEPIDGKSIACFYLAKAYLKLQSGN
ncbi:MAG: NUDIX hydrolase [Cyanobacteria bacterium J06642_3]